MPGPGRIAYDFAVLRAVPHVYRGEFTAIGVIVHARTADYLAIRTLPDGPLLRHRTAGVDHDLLLRYLASYAEICAGNPSGGAIALAPPSERFHWLTAPRSDVLQMSPLHEGLCDYPAVALSELFVAYVSSDGMEMEPVAIA